VDKGGNFFPFRSRGEHEEAVAGLTQNPLYRLAAQNEGVLLFKKNSL
jgi:hypothetical protein